MSDQIAFFGLVDAGAPFLVAVEPLPPDRDGVLPVRKRYSDGGEYVEEMTYAAFDDLIQQLASGPIEPGRPRK